MIPKILHRIWVGGEPPAHLVSLGLRWEELNPGWEFRIWRDGDLRWLQNQDLFDRAAEYVPVDGIGQFKADVARYEILRKFGGVYVDFDVEPLKPFASLLGVPAFAGWEEDGRYVGNTVLGSVPGASIWTDIIESLPGNAAKHKGRAATWVSGPRFLTRVYESDRSQLKVYPQRYFFPYSYNDLGKDTDPALKQYPDSYSIHHWEHQRKRRRRKLPLTSRPPASRPVNFSVAIMAHEKRAAWVPDLSQALGGAQVVWDRYNDRWDTGRRSLMAFDSGADYHVVVQDDALLPPNFMAGLQLALDNRPQDGPIGLYFGKVRPRASETSRLFRAAEKNNARWIRYPGPWWGVGIAVPTADIAEIVAFGDGRTDIANYDLKIARYYQKTNRMCHYTIPSLVQHRSEDNPSLVEGRTGQNRVAYQYVGDRDPAQIDWSGPVINAEGRLV